MLVEGSNLLYFSVLAFLVIFLSARMAKRIRGRFFKSSSADYAFTIHRPSGGMFERQQMPALKKCPNCSKELTLATLICEGCEYNFLSGTVGLRNRLLASPGPLTGEIAKESFA